jgi:hypothetical protein
MRVAFSLPRRTQQGVDQKRNNYSQRIKRSNPDKLENENQEMRLSSSTDTDFAVWQTVGKADINNFNPQVSRH